MCVVSGGLFEAMQLSPALTHAPALGQFKAEGATHRKAQGKAAHSENRKDSITATVAQSAGGVPRRSQVPCADGPEPPCLSWRQPGKGGKGVSGRGNGISEGSAPRKMQWPRMKGLEASLRWGLGSQASHWCAG